MALTGEQDAEYRELFSTFDKDNDGLITAQELGSVIKSLGYNPTDENLKTMIDKVDSDKDGKINYEEFKVMMSQSSNESTEDLREAFKVYDKDGNGYISAAELKSTMHSLGLKLNDEEVEAMISQADINKDGRIDYEEFIKMMKNQ
ncbi:calmodulin 1 [Gigaspora rosea]|uniref:Calmodulin 1 n=1 Tax=Gigaspora rosea TaxID=44941 RepID=A0A397WBT3_9GLOM|nr:calmodulin 1 [Gigaspora rosea]